MYIKARSVLSQPASQAAGCSTCLAQIFVRAPSLEAALGCAVLAPPFPLSFSLQLFDVEELYLFLKASGSILPSHSAHSVVIQALRGMTPTEVSMIAVES